LTDNHTVVPFRKRPPSTPELEVYRQMTRHWAPELKQLMFPEHFKRDQEDSAASG